MLLYIEYNIAVLYALLLFLRRAEDARSCERHTDMLFNQVSEGVLLQSHRLGRKISKIVVLTMDREIGEMRKGRRTRVREILC